MAVIDRTNGKGKGKNAKAQGITRNQNKHTVSPNNEHCQVSVHISEETVTYWQEQETAIKLGRMARMRKGGGSHSLFGSDRHFYREQDISYHN